MDEWQWRTGFSASSILLLLLLLLLLPVYYVHLWTNAHGHDGISYRVYNWRAVAMKLHQHRQQSLITLFTFSFHSYLQDGVPSYPRCSVHSGLHYTCSDTEWKLEMELREHGHERIRHQFMRSYGYATVWHKIQQAEKRTSSVNRCYTRRESIYIRERESFRPVMQVHV
jgi:hypothetical protein